MSQPETTTAAGETELAHAVRRGTRWVLAVQIASQAVSIGALAILYRLVLPADYGLFAAALPMVMLPRMAATLGLSTALLQERELSQRQLSTLFWYSATLGLVAAAATAAIGQGVAWAIDRPLLGTLCLALASTSLVAALANQHLALLERELKLREASAARLIAQLAGAFAAIYSARRGAGIWALVAQQYGELIVLALWAWMLEPWRPGWPGTFAEVRGLVRFSRDYSLSQLVAYAAQNIEKILIPALLGPAGDRVLGLYSQASGLMMKPVQFVVAPLTAVVVGGLSRARGDEAGHTAMVVRFYRLVAIAIFPAALGLAAVAPDVMTVLGGARWREAGWLLAALAPAMIAHALTNLSAHVLSSQGMGGRLLAAMLALLGLIATAGALGLMFGGTQLLSVAGGDRHLAVGVAMAAATTAALLLAWSLPYGIASLRSVGVPPQQVLLALWPSLRAALLMALAIAGFRWLLVADSISPAFRLLLCISAGIPLYILLAWREVAWWWREAVQTTP